jgi:hypothetical protein
MSSENLVKTSKKSVVIVGAGAAGMVSEAPRESRSKFPEEQDLNHIDISVTVLSMVVSSRHRPDLCPIFPLIFITVT